MEEGLNNKNVNRNENDEEKESDNTIDYESTTIGEGKGVVDEKGGKYFDLD